MRKAYLLAPALAGMALLGTRPAQAQTHLYDTNWRQGDRSPAAQDTGGSSAQHFLVEVAFGPYYPQVDSEFALQPGQKGPYQQVFGGGPQFYIGLEMDWQVARIPYVGVLGPGFGWGYTTRSAKALIDAGPNNPLTGTPSDENTTLTIMPMHLDAVLRIDGPMRGSGVPFVPYIKVGLGAGLWSSSTSLGSSTYTEPNGTTVPGDGISWGEHLALGGMLSLNWLDASSASKLDETVGINHVYLTGEWMDAVLNGIGSRPQMHIGSSNVTFGLAFDL
jgi:hypothetical protein